MAESNWPRPGEAPSAEDLARCVHCGLCLNACPTFIVTGLETESPRGRIYLAGAVDEGRLDLTPAVQAHWDLCLQCRACEAACPSGVPYGRIMEHVRAQTATGGGQRRLRRLLLRNVVARPRVLRAALAPVRPMAPRAGLRWLGRQSLLRLTPALRRGEAQLSAHVGPRFTPGEPLAQPNEQRAEALLFTGCVMTEMFGDVHRATGRVLARAGVAVTAPEGQGCCGALHAHDGDLAFARKLARKTIATFERHGDAPVVVNSAGCGAAMKEYGALLSGDRRWAERAERFSARVVDFAEYLARLGAGTPASYAGRVTWQDPCHLAHAQRITRQPRELLRGVAGAELVETGGADRCCGAAGIYGMVQPAMSAELCSRKAADFARQQPDVVVTANPGCQLQYEAAVREAGVRAKVMHLAEFLDEAQRNGER